MRYQGDTGQLQDHEKPPTKQAAARSRESWCLGSVQGSSRGRPVSSWESDPSGFQPRAYPVQQIQLDVLQPRGRWDFGWAGGDTALSTRHQGLKQLLESVQDQSCLSHCRGCVSELLTNHPAREQDSPPPQQAPPQKYVFPCGKSMSCVQGKSPPGRSTQKGSDPTHRQCLISPRTFQLGSRLRGNSADPSSHLALGCTDEPFCGIITCVGPHFCKSGGPRAAQAASQSHVLAAAPHLSALAVYLWA